MAHGDLRDMEYQLFLKSTWLKGVFGKFGRTANARKWKKENNVLEKCVHELMSVNSRTHSTSLPIMPMRGKTWPTNVYRPNKIDWSDRINLVFLSIELWYANFWWATN